MTPTAAPSSRQLVQMLLGRHRFLRPTSVELYCAAGWYGSSLVEVYDYHDFVSIHVLLGGRASIFSRSVGPVGRLGAMTATSHFSTEESIARDRASGAGTAIPGWDIPGLSWRICAVAPMSRTVVPFLGRMDQYLHCDSPVTHMLAERRALSQYTPHPADLSQRLSRAERQS